MSIEEAVLPRSEPFSVAGMPAPLRLWLKPVEPALELMKESADKGLGELTPMEALAWVSVFGYIALTGYMAGRLAGGLLVVALRGPYRR